MVSVEGAAMDNHSPSLHSQLTTDLYFFGSSLA